MLHAASQKFEVSTVTR